MHRESITLEDAEFMLVSEHPEELGLDASLPRSKRTREIFRAGLAVLREQQRRTARNEFYAALACDPEARAVAAADYAMAREGGFV